MMSNEITPSNCRDDGFRVSDAEVQRAVEDVLSFPQRGEASRRFSRISMAAAIALILGLGVAMVEFSKPAPCVTFACQLEALTDEELSVMMDLVEEDLPLGLEDEAAWPLLY